MDATRSSECLKAPTRQHGDITEKPTVDIFTAVRSSDLKELICRRIYFGTVNNCNRRLTALADV
jgi:hypothetical protein